MTPEALINELIEATQIAQFSSSCGCESCMTAQLSRMEHLASRRLHAIEVVSGLLEACRTASVPLHQFLAVAYEYQGDGSTFRCRTCHAVAPINAKSSGISVRHDEDCNVKAGIVAERTIYDAIAKLEGGAK